MEAIEKLLEGVFHYFTSNWIAAAVLGVVVIIAAIKKPKVLFQVSSLLVLGIAVLYIMIYLEKSMFSGVSSKEKGIKEIDRQIK